MTDKDYEEQEFLVYVHLDSQSINEEQLQSASKMELHGIETQQPLLQINNLFFQGSFDYSMGTHIFFEKDEETPVDELYAKCESYYEYVAKTNKVLKMNRVLLKSKQEDSGGGVEQDEERERLISQEEPIKAESYQAALDQLLRPGRSAPRQLSNSVISGEETMTDQNNTSEMMEIDRSSSQQDAADIS